jgi:hypothetical protein
MIHAGPGPLLGVEVGPATRVERATQYRSGEPAAAG